MNMISVGFGKRILKTCFEELSHPQGVFRWLSLPKALAQKLLAPFKEVIL